MQQIINALSEKHSTPRFEPHLTLYGIVVGKEKEMLDKMRQLAKQCSPVPVNLTGFSSKDEFFRFLFVEAESTPALQDSYQRAHALFQLFLHPQYQERKFIPHISLMYGNLPAAQKKEIIASLDQEILTPFIANTISLYRLVQEPAKWIRVRDFPLRT